ncbi:MAG TPA: endonuclease/exonuclease/phosphatase family protein [Anaerolineales bacterium]|nr:endonuclease/exonuclease/phosphatase family protein [Anaerolineales bacterium]
MKINFKSVLTIQARLYLLGLCTWLALYLLTGERLLLIALLDNVVVYFFMPLPLVLLAAAYTHRWELWVGTLLGAAAFAWLWGGLFLPPPSRATAGVETLTVMTYNVLGWHEFSDPVIATIRQEAPDVVLIQELNPSLARALQTELADEYPYQVLDPQTGVTGMGTLSRYPLRPHDQELPLDWIGAPQELLLDWNGHTLSLVNFHMQSSTMGGLNRYGLDNQKRTRQARALAEFAAGAGPLIAGGDANSTPLTAAYRLLSSQLQDAWGQAGFGLGHTFPGSDIPGSMRPRLAGVPVPQWLARIDYIFHSTQLKTLQARTARFDGVSDHRGVVAVLVWAAP